MNFSIVVDCQTLFLDRYQRRFKLNIIGRGFFMLKEDSFLKYFHQHKFPSWAVFLVLDHSCLCKVSYYHEIRLNILCYSPSHFVFHLITQSSFSIVQVIFLRLVADMLSPVTGSICYCMGESILRRKLHTMIYIYQILVRGEIERNDGMFSSFEMNTRPVMISILILFKSIAQMSHSTITSTFDDCTYKFILIIQNYTTPSSRIKQILL